MSANTNVTAYYNGLLLITKIHADSLADATLNVSGLGAISIKKNGTTNIEAGDFRADMMVAFLYRDAVFHIQSSTYVGTAASQDVGTAIGDVVQLEDVGGSAGLPAVDGSQLTGVRTLGKFATSLPARLWEPNVTGGSGSEVKNQQANGVMYVSLPYGNTAVEAAQAAWQVPTSVDRTATISGRFLWTGVPAGGSYDVVWRVRAVAVGNGGAINATFGSYVSVTAPGSTNSYRIAAFAGLDPGSWSANATLMLEVSRDPLDAADTLTGDAQFVGLEIEPTYNLPNDD